MAAVVPHVAPGKGPSEQSPEGDGEQSHTRSRGTVPPKGKESVPHPNHKSPRFPLCPDDTRTLSLPSVPLSASRLLGGTSLFLPSLPPPTISAPPGVRSAYLALQCLRQHYLLPPHCQRAKNLPLRLSPPTSDFLTGFTGKK